MPVSSNRQSSQRKIPMLPEANALGNVGIGPPWGGGSVSAVNLTSSFGSYVLFFPLDIGKAMAVKSIGYEITTVDPSNPVQMAIYSADSNFLPVKKIVPEFAMTVSSIGHVIDPVDFVLPKRFYVAIDCTQAFWSMRGFSTASRAGSVWVPIDSYVGTNPASGFYYDPAVYSTPTFPDEMDIPAQYQDNVFAGGIVIPNIIFTP